MNQISEQLLGAFEIAMDTKISKLQYDKTIQATIEKLVNADTGEYKVKYQDGIMSAFADNPSDVFETNETVYVTVPEGDFNNKKFITHKLANNSLSVGQYAQLAETIVEVSPEFSDLGFRYNAAPYGLVVGEKLPDQIAILADESSNDNANKAFKTYADQYEFIQVSASFRTEFIKEEPGHVSGDYGICLVFENNEGQSLAYFMNLNDFNGNPYRFYTWSPQTKVFSIPKGEITSLKSITFYEKGFEKDSDTTNSNLFMTNFSLKFVEKVDMTTVPYYLSIVPDKGLSFTDSIDSIKLEGKIIHQGSVVTPSSCIYKWFERDLTIEPGSEGYDQRAGWGWKAIVKTEGSPATETTPAVEPEYYSDSYFLVERDKVSRTKSYKLVAVWDSSIVMTQQITLTNLSSDYSDLTIVEEYQEGKIALRLSKDGVVGDWYYLNGSGTLVNISAPILEVLTAKYNEQAEEVNQKRNNGILTDQEAHNELERLEEEREAAIKEARKSVVIQDYLFYSPMTFYCQVYTENNTNLTYLCELTYVYQKKEKESWVSAIFSGESIFLWNADGYFYTDNVEEEHVLTATITTNKRCSCTWWWDGNKIENEFDNTKLEDTMFKSLRVDPTPIENSANIDSTEKKLYYILRDRFNEEAKKNILILQVEDQDSGAIETFSKEITCLKIGDPGTNGTRYSSIIQITSDSDYKFLKSYEYGEDSPFVKLECRVFLDSDDITDDNTNYTITYDWTELHNLKIVEQENNTVSVKAINNNNLRYVRAAIKIESNDSSQTTMLYNFFPINSCTADYDPNIDLSMLSNYIKYASNGRNPSFRRTVPTIEGYTIRTVSNSPIKISNNKFKVPDEFDPEKPWGLLNISNGSITIHHPILMYMNTFGNEAINNWDGVSVDLGTEEDPHVFAPQVGAGGKDPVSNKFTGVIMGKDSGQKENNKYITGLYGYKDGVSTFGLMENGRAYFGKSGKGRITIDGTEATIKGGGENGGDSETGMTLDLYNEGDNPKKKAILVGKDKFYVQYDGQLHAKEAEIEGTINAGKGSVGGWEIANSRLHSKGISLIGSKHLFFSKNQDQIYCLRPGSTYYYSKSNSEVSGEYGCQVDVSNWDPSTGKVTFTKTSDTDKTEYYAFEDAFATNVYEMQINKTTWYRDEYCTGNGNTAKKAYWIEKLSAGEAAYLLADKPYYTKEDFPTSGRIGGEHPDKEIIIHKVFEVKERFKDAVAFSFKDDLTTTYYTAALSNTKTQPYISFQFVVGNLAGIFYLKDDKSLKEIFDPSEYYRIIAGNSNTGLNTDYPFSVTSKGNLTAKDANITGTIRAKTGFIGYNVDQETGKETGWMISKSSISSYEPTQYVLLKDALYYTDKNLTQNKESASQELEIKNREVVSQDTKVVSFKFPDDNKTYYTKEQNTEPTYQSYIQLSGDGSYAIWAGHTQWNKAPFKLTHSGKLTAEDANIKGTITANKGSIGDWTISNGRLFSRGLTFIGANQFFFNSQDSKYCLRPNSVYYDDAGVDNEMIKATYGFQIDVIDWDSETGRVTFTKTKDPNKIKYYTFTDAIATNVYLLSKDTAWYSTKELSASTKETATKDYWIEKLSAISALIKDKDYYETKDFTTTTKHTTAESKEIIIRKTYKITVKTTTYNNAIAFSFVDEPDIIYYTPFSNNIKKSYSFQFLTTTETDYIGKIFYLDYNVNLTKVFDPSEYYRIIAGTFNVDYKDYPFFVTNKGMLKANNAKITGEINAKTGYIGGDKGWKIQESRISSNEEITWELPAGSSYYIWDADNKKYKLSDTTIGKRNLIEANRGTDGYWLFDENKYAKDDDVVANGTGVVLSTKGKYALKIIGNGVPSFSVQQDGTMAATSAVISGKITAEEGSIGNWQIKTDEIYQGNVHLYSGKDPAKSSSGKINESVEYYKWNETTKKMYKVSSNLVKNTQVYFTGDIKEYNNKTYYAFKLDNDAIIYYMIPTSANCTLDVYRIWAGGSSPQQAKFSITNNGILIAKDAILTGEIQAKTGRIGCNKDGEGGWIISNNTISNDAITWKVPKGITYYNKDGQSVGTTGGVRQITRHIDNWWKYKYTNTNGNTVYYYIKEDDVKANAYADGNIIVLSCQGKYAIQAGNVSDSGEALFTVSRDGKVTATGAEISGKITAEEGRIGNWQINSNSDGALRSTLTDANASTRIYINGKPSSGDNVIEIKTSGTLTDKETTATNGHFYVTDQGKLFAQNAEIHGTLKSKAGTIGTWNISNNAISTLTNETTESSSGTTGMAKSSFNGYIQADSNKTYSNSDSDNRITGIAFWSGMKYVKEGTAYYLQGSNSGTFFAVTHSGKLYCKDANIAGYINADKGGMIGSWTIASTTDDHPGALKNSDGTVYLSPSYVKLPGITISQVEGNYVTSIDGILTAKTGSSIGGWTSKKSGTIEYLSAENGNDKLQLWSNGFIRGINDYTDANDITVGELNPFIEIWARQSDEESDEESTTKINTTSLGLIGGDAGNNKTTYNAALTSSTGLVLEAAFFNPPTGTKHANFKYSNNSAMRLEAHRGLYINLYNKNDSDESTEEYYQFSFKDNGLMYLSDACYGSGDPPESPGKGAIYFKTS